MTPLAQDRPARPASLASRAPGLLPLNGADFFFLGLDRIMRRDGQNGNAGQMVVELGPARRGGDAETRAPSLIAERVSAGFALLVARLPWLCAAVGRRFLVGLPCWRPLAHDAAREPILTEHGPECEARPTLLAALGRGVARRGLRARFDLLRRADGGAILAMTWDHTLMDARGAEMLLCAMDRIAAARAPDAPESSNLAELAELLDSLAPADATARRDGRSLRERNRETQRYFRRMMELAQRPIVSPGGGSRDMAHARRGARPAYEVVTLDAAESRRIAANAERACGHLSETPFLLAAAARAVDALLAARGVRPAGHMIPVAYDCRLKGDAGPALGNHVSFFFYQVDAAPAAGGALALEELARALRQQTIDQMREDMPGAATTALDLGRRFPLWWHRHLQRRCFKDEIATFFFSNTGAVFAGQSMLFGAPIENAFSAPAMPRLPGLGVTFNRFGDRLNLVIAWAEGALTDAERRSLIAHLRGDLLACGPGN